MKKKYDFKQFGKLTNNNEVNKLINIFLAVSILFVVFYLITLMVTNKDTEVSEPVNIQYGEILVSKILDQKQDLYYVLATKEEDVNNDLYDYYLTEYVRAEQLVAFEINLDNIFNKPFVKEESNLSVEDLSDIAFKDATLLRVEKGKITEALEGKDEIREYLVKKIK
jgi:hypothetical protein